MLGHLAKGRIGGGRVSLYIDPKSRNKQLSRELMRYASVANFAKWGGGVIHMYFNPTMGGSPMEGGGVRW